MNNLLRIQPTDLLDIQLNHGESVKPPWEDRPYSLVSLYDMQILSMENFLELMRVLAEGRQRLKNDATIITPDHRIALLESLPNLEKNLKGLGAKGATVYLRRGLEFLSRDNCTWGEYGEFIKGLHERIVEEATSEVFLHINTYQELFWKKSLFGEEADAKFPSIIYDVEEAGKCLALDRGTACVFHLMRVMEAGLRHLCSEAASFGISIPDPDSNRSWHSWLHPLEREFQKDRKLKLADWNAIEPLYAQVASHLRTVSIAWRNPTMHVGTKYTPEEAGDIFNAVRVFMRHLATAKLSK